MGNRSGVAANLQPLGLVRRHFAPPGLLKSDGATSSHSGHAAAWSLTSLAVEGSGERTILRPVVQRRRTSTPLQRRLLAKGRLGCNSILLPGLPLISETNLNQMDNWGQSQSGFYFFGGMATTGACNFTGLTHACQGVKRPHLMKSEVRSSKLFSEAGAAVCL